MRNFNRKPDMFKITVRLIFAIAFIGMAIFMTSAAVGIYMILAAEPTELATGLGNLVGTFFEAVESAKQ